MSNILLIDDDPTIRLILKRTLQNNGYEVTVANNGEEGLMQAQQMRPALIICDWMMPVMDGLEVCRQIKTDGELSTTFFILLTSRGEVDDRVQGLDAGADDFLSKPIEMNELKARVRAGLRLYQMNQNLQAQKQILEVLNQDLHTQKQILETELAEAAEYVRSLLPTQQPDNVIIESLFQPSAQLGGDCFDYYQLDDDKLAIYLLDVSGHGVGSALLSVSVLNVMRSQSLPNTDFSQPSQVLSALNRAFQGIQNEKYFTIWYGVYNRVNRQLVYASAGHPPAVLLSTISTNNIEVKQLEADGFPIGLIPDVDFDEHYLNLEESSTLYVFSDGAYEIHLSNGQIWGANAFIELLKDSQKSHISNLQQLIPHIQALTATEKFEDDLSLLKVHFN